MLRKWSDIIPALKEPFAASEIEWRVAQAGKKGDAGNVWCKVLCYLTARAIDDRLDAVAGGENWWVEYRHEANAVLCGLSIRGLDDTGEARTVTKWDGADRTDIEAVKGGLSGAKKRAGVPWGIGRYLYNLDEGWAVTSLNNEKGAEWHWMPASDGKGNPRKAYPSFYWKAPELPQWALPAGEKAKTTRKQPERPAAGEDAPAAPAIRTGNPFGIPGEAWLKLDACKTYDELYQMCASMREDSRGANPAGENWNINLNRFWADRSSFLKDAERNGLESDGRPE